MHVIVAIATEQFVTSTKSGGLVIAPQGNNFISVVSGRYRTPRTRIDVSPLRPQEEGALRGCRESAQPNPKVAVGKIAELDLAAVRQDEPPWGAVGERDGTVPANPGIRPALIRAKTARHNRLLGPSDHDPPFLVAIDDRVFAIALGPNIPILPIPAYQLVVPFATGEHIVVGGTDENVFCAALITVARIQLQGRTPCRV